MENERICCGRKEHGNWCKDFPAEYQDKEGNCYCIFHVPADVEIEDKERLVHEALHRTLDLAAEKDGCYIINGATFTTPVHLRFESEYEEEMDIRFGDCEFKTYVRVYDSPNVAIKFYTSRIGSHFGAYNFKGDLTLVSSTIKAGTFFKGISGDVELFDCTLMMEFKCWECECESTFEIRYSKIYDDVIVLYKNKMKSLWLSDSVFKGNVYVEDLAIDEKFYIFRAHFEKELQASDCRFTEMSANRTIFDGPAIFANTQGNSADFTRAKFNAEADFSGAKIDTLDFEKAEFKDRAILHEVKAEDLVFRAARAGDLARFTGMVIAGSLDLSQARFHSRAQFDDTRVRNVDASNAHFSGVASFINFNSTDKTNFERVLFEQGAVFQNAKLENADFAGAYGREKIVFFEMDIAQMSFSKVIMDSFKFIDCDGIDISEKDKSSK